MLGPVEALFEMTAFVVALAAAGWRPGDAFPTGDALLAASGAAFCAVVIGQMANAFACRSATVWPGRLGWRTNPMLLWAVGAELVALGAFILIPSIADLLEHSMPPLAGLAVALATAPAVLAADAAHKAWHRTKSTRRGTKDPTPRTFATTGPPDERGRSSHELN